MVKHNTKISPHQQMQPDFRETTEEVIDILAQQINSSLMDCSDPEIPHSPVGYSNQFFVMQVRIFQYPLLIRLETFHGEGG